MTDREQDKRVAEILGFVVVHEHWMRPIDQPDNYRVEQRLPNFTTNPAEDYKVLEWARENFENKIALASFMAEIALLLVVQARRANESTRDLFQLQIMFYVPGLYSRALIALDAKGLLK